MSIRSLLGLVLALGGAAAAPLAAEPHAGFVGSPTCAGCHAAEAAAWQGSHHDHAMRSPGPESVLGDFEGAEFTAAGVSTRFYRDGERYMVRTEGPDGAPADYAVRYTFGTDPLQQYLLEMPDGRLQALGIAWDARPREAGGQRWFHLYPDQPPRPGERLHWSSPDQNWNHMCADCHSTDVVKGYDAAAGRYRTSYAQVNVGCEACHGPGAAHVAWARQPERAGDPRLAVGLDERRGVAWRIDPGTGQPVRSTPRTSSHEIDTCARCHSRRSQLAGRYVHGAPLGDHYRLALLEQGLYHADGQPLEEVYVHGSFLQSRMHAAGVTCSDCHDPHSLALRAEGDALCATCHDAGRYARTEHHHHRPQSAAARCVSCHMPATTYMVVDPRRDHGFRVPRPDLSASLGVPNACNGCHADRGPAWSAAQVQGWIGGAPRGFQRHAQALHDARRGLPAARDGLLGVARDDTQSGIARATAAAALAPWLDREVAAVLAALLEDPDPLLRRAAVEALSRSPPRVRVAALSPRLRDPVRDVRQAAALALVALPPDTRAGVDAALLDDAVADYRATLQRDADRPEAQANLGVLLTYLGALAGAESAYRRALNIEPGYVPALVNLADLLRGTGRDAEVGALLDAFLAAHPEAAAAHHVRGLWLVRQRQPAKAVDALRRAARLDPDNARYGFVLAVALHGDGRVDAALAELGRATIGTASPPRSPGGGSAARSPVSTRSAFSSCSGS
jgi:predicted CXXCH cytochrome family protein